jgi:copper chaperone CopZ
MGGVRSVEVSFATGDAKVEYDELLTSREKLKLAVTGAGYGVDRQ